jgi:hypothetical protein
LCSGGEIEDLNFGEQFVAQSEQSLNEHNQIPDIFEESPVYSESVSIDSDDENDNDLLRMLGFEGEDIEVDKSVTDLGGGANLFGGEPDGSSDEDKEVDSETPPPPPNPGPQPVSSSSEEKDEEVYSDTPPPSSLEEKEEEEEKEAEVESNTPPSSSSSEEGEEKEAEVESDSKSEIVIPPLGSLSSSASTSASEEVKTDTQPSEEKPPIKIGEVIKQPEIEFEEEKAVIPEPAPEEVEVEEELVIDVKPKTKAKKMGIAAKNNPETRIPIGKPVLIENKVHDITGMKLRFPNPFSKRIEDKMPQLFVKSKDDKMDLYTRMCRMNLQARRHPIILARFTSSLNKNTLKIKTNTYDKLING